MTEQEKVQLVADLLWAEREAYNRPNSVSFEKRFQKALKSLLKHLLGREPTDQEIQGAEYYSPSFE